ncbi:hypothetical protein [Hydrogenivirga sp.]
MEEQELKIEELYGLMEDVDSLQSPTREQVEELNYRLRKFLESLLVKSNYDYELLDYYYQVGENYEEIKGNPGRALTRIREILVAVAAKLEKE